VTLTFGDDVCVLLWDAVAVDILPSVPVTIVTLEELEWGMVHRL
jgi:hypothetical protein